MSRRKRRKTKKERGKFPLRLLVPPEARYIAIPCDILIRLSVGTKFLFFDRNNAPPELVIPPFLNIEMGVALRPTNTKRAAKILRPEGLLDPLLIARLTTVALTFIKSCQKTPCLSNGDEWRVPFGAREGGEGLQKR